MRFGCNSLLICSCVVCCRCDCRFLGGHKSGNSKPQSWWIPYTFSVGIQIQQLCTAGTVLLLVCSDAEESTILLKQAKKIREGSSYNPNFQYFKTTFDRVRGVRG